MPQLALLHTTINGLTTNAPNLALSQHILIQSMMGSNLQSLANRIPPVALKIF
jgi:hypothetical protein